VNTFIPLILPKFLATDAFFVFLMVQFIRGIPRELDEAARIDGCGHWQIFSRVMIPLMGPALATTAIFTFIWTWSDFFTPLIYLTDPDKYTVPVALRSFLDSTSGSNWGAMFAMSIVSWSRSSWRSCSASGSWSRASPPPAGSDAPSCPRSRRGKASSQVVTSTTTYVVVGTGHRSADVPRRHGRRPSRRRGAGRAVEPNPGRLAVHATGWPRPGWTSAPVATGPPTSWSG
jgi:hypothetical protein